jgi:hypothetical protein
MIILEEAKTSVKVKGFRAKGKQKLFLQYVPFCWERGNVVVEPLCYKPEGRVFDTR